MSDLGCSRCDGTCVSPDDCPGVVDEAEVDRFARHLDVLTRAALTPLPAPNGDEEDA